MEKQTSDDAADEEEGDQALWPPAERKYRRGVADGNTTQSTSLDLGCCSKQTYDAYCQEIRALHWAKIGASKIHGEGLFVTENVMEGKYVMGYTGNRRSGASARALHRAMYTRGLCPHGLVTVNVDDGYDKCIIDPRNNGNDARLMNHSCDPNCLLMTVPVTDRYIVKLLALKDIPARTEATINFGRSTRSRRHRLPCNCQAAMCTVFLWA